MSAARWTFHQRNVGHYPEDCGTPIQLKFRTKQSKHTAQVQGSKISELCLRHIRQFIDGGAVGYPFSGAENCLTRSGLLGAGLVVFIHSASILLLIGQIFQVVPIVRDGASLLLPTWFQPHQCVVCVFILKTLQHLTNREIIKLFNNSVVDVVYHHFADVLKNQFAGQLLYASHRSILSAFARAHCRSLWPWLAQILIPDSRLRSDNFGHPIVSTSMIWFEM